MKDEPGQNNNTWQKRQSSCTYFILPKSYQTARDSIDTSKAVASGANMFMCLRHNKGVYAKLTRIRQHWIKFNDEKKSAKEGETPLL